MEGHAILAKALISMYQHMIWHVWWSNGKEREEKPKSQFSWCEEESIEV